MLIRSSFDHPSECGFYLCNVHYTELQEQYHNSMNFLDLLVGMSAMNLHWGFLERFPNDQQDFKNKLQLKLNLFIVKVTKTSILWCSKSNNN